MINVGSIDWLSKKSNTSGVFPDVSISIPIPKAQLKGERAKVMFSKKVFEELFKGVGFVRIGLDDEHMYFMPSTEIGMNEYTLMKYNDKANRYYIVSTRIEDFQDYIGDYSLVADKTMDGNDIFYITKKK